MGAIADQYADFAFITSDNPRKEDPEEILRDVEKAVKESFMTESLARIDEACGELDDAVAMWSLYGARRLAWNQAELLWALGDHVSTPKEQIFSDRIDAGHLGVFIGRSALEDHWPRLMRQVAAYSQPDIERKASPARAARARAIKPASVTSAPA